MVWSVACEGHAEIRGLAGCVSKVGASVSQGVAQRAVNNTKKTKTT